ncbi:MAG: DUF5610 domain-containing protein [Gammaproteobacteria bacterium]|nr:DUF5610 domain-containing protein [Gammaproteobacteria bacterium]MBQ0839571.1 DUF5610 domain-containing protein [Gammaproteobacteria bacterium]
METANFGSNISNLAHTTDKQAAPFGQTVSAMAHGKKTSESPSLDAAIVNTNLSLSVGDANSSLTLVLKTALEGINAELAPTLGSGAIQAAVDTGIDVSPEATAERIVSLSTAFFGAYQEANPELDFDTALNQFVDVISGGIDQGFAEAREILDGLQVLTGDIASNIDTTYQLVQDKLSAFVDNLSSEPEPAEQSAEQQLGLE